MKGKIILLILMICAVFSGCGSDKPACKIEVVTSYGYYDEEKREVINGTFSETITAVVGDVFYESHNGEWALNPEDVSKYSGVIAEITKVDEKEITAVIYGEETVIRYGTGRRISSEMIIYDGPSYEYVMNILENVE